MFATLTRLICVVYRACVCVCRLICLAFGGTIGMSLLILACALRQFGLWWPLFVVVFYLLALLPRLVVRSLSEASRSHRDGSVFFSVGMVLSSFALPIVLARASVVSIYL